MFDSMGHGLRSAVLGSLVISAYRNPRREHRPATLQELMAEVDAVIASYANGVAFVTGIFAQLDVTTGSLRWMTAGHPQPLHLRRATVLPAVQVRRAPPLGLGSFMADIRDVDIAEVVLEPGDALLFYTDGVVDGRGADGDAFGEERLADLLTRESSSDRPSSEVLRVLVHPVIEHQQAQLKDDASTLYVSGQSSVGRLTSTRCYPTAAWILVASPT